ncbi:putative phosphoglycerate mutase [Hephaestia caeni]|uniref:Putative phosphoglycerate mutase n=1 Tax=Hephaestia caeni TaxID=645617 RepID=A0A397PAU5_9SPHN|nr:histidine phosphatase family protein [Hephaestia caeni]RIA46696.1 putative phosphoglycerate mutase [Hephaestia caeni]
MTDSLPEITLVRHGETLWSRTRRHTGRTDIPLTPAGEEAAVGLTARLPSPPLPIVWSSPSQRAFDTCRLAGFAAWSAKKPDLAEWDYGDYEGRTTADIQAERPGWNLFRDGCPGGETAADVGMRVDRIIAALRDADCNALIFSSAHVMDVLAARWLGLEPQQGSLFALDTASISVLGYAHDQNEPVILRWNQVDPAPSERHDHG